MVRRVYAEKKEAYAVQARKMRHEIRRDLGITSLEDVRIFVRYDVERVSEDTYRRALRGVFAELPVDDLYEETLPKADRARVFSVAYLPGQFDQRADSAEQCIRLLSESENPVIHTAVTYMLIGDISDEELGKIISHAVNPVDSCVAGE